MAETTVGQRSTKQRAAVAELLDDVQQFRSAQQIHEMLREREETVGLATVYRILQSLAQAHVVDVITNDEGELLYRGCGPALGDHHHHLICRVCGRTVEISAAVVEEWTNRVAQNHGFSQIEHTIEIFGTCAGCVASANSTTPQE